MTYVDILLAKLLGQRLAQSPQRMLARRKRARRDIATHTRCRAGEEQGPAAAKGVDLIAAERRDRLPRKRERRSEVALDGARDVRLGHVEERLERAAARVPQRRAHLAAARARPRVRADRVEHAEHRLVRVVRHGKRGGLAARAIDLGGELGKVLGVARDERDSVARLREEATVSLCKVRV